MSVATVKEPISKKASGPRVVRTFAANLRAMRVAAGMTQSDLAAVVGMTQGQISHYEMCRREPTLSEAATIADALDATLTDLLSMT